MDFIKFEIVDGHLYVTFPGEEEVIVDIIDAQTFEFIMNSLKMLLDIDKIQEEEIKKRAEAILALFVFSTVQEIVIKTNRNKFPKDLRYLVIDIVNDLYNQYLESSNPSENNVIQSMSEDGRNVNFGTSDFSKIKMQLLIQQKLNDNETLIRRYKLLYKVECKHEPKN